MYIVIHPDCVRYTCTCTFCRIVLSDCQPLGSENNIILDADIRQSITNQFYIDIEVAS